MSKYLLFQASPARQGDYIDFVSELDLLVGLCACPQGDVSIKCGEDFPEDKCFPLDVAVYTPDQEVTKQWQQMNNALEK